MKKRVIALILLGTMIFAFVSCKNENRIEYCELGIVLTKDFKGYDSGGAFNVAYSDGNTIVGILRYSFVDCDEIGLSSALTPLRFAEVYLEMMDRTVDEGIKMSGDIPYFSYTQIRDGDAAYFYMPTFYRTPYAYFVITFITPKIREEVGRVEFLEYMSSVYLLNEYM